jgi:hypothetical protein
MRILVANDPVTYRDAIASALRVVHDDLDIIDVPASELDSFIAYLDPDLVICSHLSEVVETRTRTWILLYPNLERRVEVNVDGTWTRHEDMEMDAILDLIGQERLRCPAS